MFKRISIRAQFLLIAMFLEEQTHGDFSREIVELKEAKYLNSDYLVTKKGEAFVHSKNKVGHNFKDLVNRNSTKANMVLANVVVEYFNNTEKGKKYINRLTSSVVEDKKQYRLTPPSIVF